MKILRFAVILTLVCAVLSDASFAAQVWVCSLRIDEMTVKARFSIKGDMLWSSGGDYSNEQVAYHIVENSASYLVAVQHNSYGDDVITINKSDDTVKESDPIEVFEGKCALS